MTELRYEEFEHTADVGITAYGSSLEELLENAACGMFSILAGEHEITATVEREIVVPREEDDELLLVRFLSELLSLADTAHLLFAECKVALGSEHLRARCLGERIGPETAGLGIDIKAVTRHLLEVDPAGGRARVLFDV
jgi:SHS2 domain-containing protein